jgi:hypothetical protein
MGMKFFLLHGTVHFLIALTISIVFKLDWFYFFLVLFFSAVVDLDHLPILFKRGFNYWYKISWKAQRHQAYPLHNFLIVFISFLGSFFILKNFLVGIFFLSVFLHLVWDLLRDIFILKMNINHWNVKYQK